MDGANGARGQPNFSKQVFEIALRPTCSDGKIWPEDQYKTAERLNLGESDADRRKHQEYLLKLGGLLRDQFLIQDPVARGRNYILKELPEYYHIRRKPKSRVDKDKKDQFDFIIYGHPTSDRSGNPRSYASPNEFFHHLIWLISGSEDPGYCACKLCNKSAKHEPESLKKRILAATAPVPPNSSPVVQIPATASPTASPALQSATMRRTPSASSTTPRTITQLKPATQIQTITAAVSQPPAPVVTAPPIAAAPPAAEAPTVVDEAVIFREGEIVWYKNNNAWRIGVVLKAVPADESQQAQIKCLIQPLAHSALKLEAVLKLETDMRPFLAFSVPPVNMKDVQGLRMNQVDWKRMQAQYAGEDRQKQEIVGLEASKMVVVEIDKSYSTFNTYPPDPAAAEKQRVGGVFLGAERISAGEAVRLRLTPAEIDPTWVKGLPVVLVLRDIYVATDGLHFFGDVYRLQETASQQPSSHPTRLPITMLREQQFRSEVKKQMGTRLDWILVQQNVDKPETAIRGRFYETSKLMPVLDPARYQAALSRGVVEDVQAYLNNRLDSAGNYIGRRKNRLETLSTSVPEGFHLSFGPDVVEN